MNIRVLHVFKTFRPDTFGGIERMIHNLCLATAPHGIQSTVFTLSPDPTPQELDMDGYTVVRARRDFMLRSNPVSFTAIRQFKALALKADIIHYQYPWPWMDMMHFVANHQKPSIVSYQSDIVKQRVLGLVYRPLMDKFLSQMRFIVASSEHYTKSSPVLQRHKAQTKAIPIGLQEASYPTRDSEIAARWPRPFFLWVGVMRYYKGLQFLIDAAGATNADILLAGSGPEEPMLRAKVASLGLKNVHFLGAISDAQKMSLLATARGFVFPSHLRSEAYGLALVEAAMAGCAMISCEMGTGTSFINKNGDTGIVVPPANSAALKDAMNQLVGNADLARQYGARARLRFEKLLTAKTMGEAYVDLYRQMLS